MDRVYVSLDLNLERVIDRFTRDLREGTNTDRLPPESEFPFARFFNPLLSTQGVSNTGPLAEHFIRGTSSLFTRILHPASNKGIGRLSGRRKTCIKRVDCPSPLPSIRFQAKILRIISSILFLN